MHDDAVAAAADNHVAVLNYLAAGAAAVLGLGATTILQI
jgi:hypothetical protein